MIPPKIREQLANDPFMKRCIYHNSDCSDRVEWEHALYYSGKKIQETFAIVPCCTYHHRGAGLNKEFNQAIALSRATDEDLAKYPRANFQQMKKYLIKKYE